MLSPAEYLVDARVGNVVLFRLQNTGKVEAQLGGGGGGVATCMPPSCHSPWSLICSITHDWECAQRISPCLGMTSKAGAGTSLVH